MIAGWRRNTAQTLALAILLTGMPVAPLSAQEANASPGAEPADPTVVSGQNCTFRNNPDDFLNQQERFAAEANARTQLVAARMAKLGGPRNSAAIRPVDAASLERRNFIDEELFGRLQQEKIPVAPRTTDEEFVRRIYLDLVGRIPTPFEFRTFLENRSLQRRDELIERLLYSEEFVYRWASYFMDTFQIARTATNVTLQTNGRNAMWDYLVGAIGSGKSYREIATEMMTADGNNFTNGAGNWVARSITPGGPVQDRYDTMLVMNAGTFLGLGHYDCIACHDGRGKMEQLSLWGRGVPRIEAYRMAAFFSRLGITQVAQPMELSGSFNITTATTGSYNLNTNFGNRPNRVRVGTQTAVTPEYRNGAVPGATDNWRAFFAKQVVADPMFSKNLANRLFKHFFVLGLVEPVDGLDPARLDPDVTPADPWTHQTVHVKLLARMAQYLTDNDYNLREFMRLLVSSNAYQMSSRYDGAEWKTTYAPFYARHLARRMEAEEIHDTLSQASGNWQNYTILGFGETVQRAWRMPDASEPSSNGGVRTFLDNFLRGNRSSQLRRQDGSILQQLSLMNDTVVRDRIRTSSSPNVRALVSNTDLSFVAEELFLLYLGRLPMDAERSKAVAHLSKATTTAARTTAIEDLAWALVNRTDFIFSY